jgi:hypothetical protein
MAFDETFAARIHLALGVPVRAVAPEWRGLVGRDGERCRRLGTCSGLLGFCWGF